MMPERCLEVICGWREDCEMLEYGTGRLRLRLTEECRLMDNTRIMGICDCGQAGLGQGGFDRNGKGEANAADPGVDGNGNVKEVPCVLVSPCA